MYFTIMILVFINLKIFEFIINTTETKECSSDIIYHKFSDFNELNFTCVINQTKSVVFYPRKSILLDSQLKQPPYINSSIITPTKIIFINLKGIDILSHHLLNYLNSNNYHLTIQKSIFEFYFQNSKIKQLECSSEAIYTLFQNIFPKNINLIFLNSNKYSSSICPFFFKNSSIKQLTIKNLVNVFVKKNYIQFANDSKTICDNLENNCDRLELKDVFKILITNKILSKCVFKRLNYIYIYGVLNGIEKNVFIHFLEIKQIRLQLENLKELISYKLDWLKYINFNEKTLKNISFITEVNLENSDNLNSIAYKFLNEDYCDFFQDILKLDDIRLRLMRLGFFIKV